MILTMTLILTSLDTSPVLAQIGQNIDAPSTYGQQTYPNSGSTKNRRNIMGGKASSASKASDVSGPKNSEKDQQQQEEKNDAPIKEGPYNQNEKYQFDGANDE